MSREIPQAVRAVAGLAVTVLDETRRLPQTLTSLPVRVLGLAMQVTMKLQQHYSGLVARGDEVLTGLRGEDEPGLATFDEDLPAATSGDSVNSSAFDRAVDVPDEELAEEVAQLIDDEVSGLPQDPAPEEVVEALQDITDEVEAAGLTLAEPGLTTEDALESALLETDGAPEAAGPSGDAAPGEDLAADVATDVDVLTSDAEAAGAEAAGAEAAGSAPVAGYDGFTVAQLRGRLRGYQLATVQDLLAYEEATQAREPYLRMLRNRLEKIEQQAVEASPLAPRGA